MEKNSEKRSRIELVKTLFDYVQNGCTTPNQLIGAMGINLARLNEYLKLIVFIQQLPPLEITQLGKNRLISIGKPKEKRTYAGNGFENHQKPTFLPEAEAIPHFIDELGGVIKTLKWKVSSNTLKESAAMLFRYWSALNWATAPPARYPEDTIKKIVRKLLPNADDLTEEELGEVESAIDACWDEFAP
jgi:predicted transcriptional regulator